jgi:hypothetical protein
MKIYNDKDIVKSKCIQLYQIAIVKDGWGWLYTDEDAQYLETINKHIDILCDNFNMHLVPAKDAVVSIACYETDESYTFEGEAECISLYKRYEEGCPTVQDNLTVKRVDSLLSEVWSKYDSKAPWVLKGQDND